MKKFLTATLIVAMAVMTVVGCGKKKDDKKETTSEAKETTTVEDTSKEETSSEETSADETKAPIETSVMTYEQYAAAAVDDEVTVQAIVMAKQSWWENKVTVYAADADGAYFIYEMACSEDDNEKLVPGTGIIVHGFKSEWEGEVEIVDATFEICDAATSVPSAKDVTDKLGTDELINYQNQLVTFTGLTIEASNDDGAAFLYKWDGSGAQGDDLYFKVSDGTNTYSFTVESYLCDKDTDVYKAVEALKVGDVVDMEGFLYWYQGANPHITSVTVK